MIFRAWPDYLPREVEVCPVQLPGRENRLREAPYTRMPALVDALADAMLPYLDVPYAMFGHSLGALVAFELARLFRRQRRPGPVHLFVSGRIAPQLADRFPPIHYLPEAEFVQAVRRLHGTPDAVFEHSELLQLVLPALRADFTVNETYRYAPDAPLHCPITVFGGLEDERTNPEELSAWCAQANGACDVRMLPGNHFFLQSSVALLLEHIAAVLAEATPGVERIAGG